MRHDRARRRRSLLESLDQSIDRLRSHARHIGEKNDGAAGSLAARPEPQRQRARQTGGRIVVLYEGAIEPGERRFDPLCRCSYDDDQGTRAREGGFIRHMANERLAREFREIFGVSGGYRSVCRCRPPE